MPRHVNDAGRAVWRNLDDLMDVAACDERIAVIEPLDAGWRSRQAVLAPYLFAAVVVFNDHRVRVDRYQPMAVWQSLATPSRARKLHSPTLLVVGIELND